MAKAGPEGLITALDIGSSKVSAMIAQKGDGGELIVLGTGQRESRGVKRGFIADMEKSEIAIREAVEQAERIAGTQVDQVFVGFSAGGLVSNVAGVADHSLLFSQGQLLRCESGVEAARPGTPGTSSGEGVAQ